ncbi:MAG: hypothetical protein CM15mP44_6520 [Candidatus Neomarinimicrobiota bacterium]|nr:MAG: hypothetical protein CM15mP44_6520 [Candidatus Neomarinimicrobiota bacterium]
MSDNEYRKSIAVYYLTTPSESHSNGGKGATCVWHVTTPLIEYTDGDDAMAIADGGRRYAPFHRLHRLPTGSTVEESYMNGSITDSGGSISFGDENVSTTGTLSAGAATLATGSTVGILL